MNTKPKLLNKNALLLSACLLPPFSAAANSLMLEAKEAELAAVTSVNAAYYNAFKGNAEDNWVYQLRNEQLLEEKCYLSKKEPFEIGAKYQHKGLEMECIQVGLSTRIFWPTRWVYHCQQLGVNLGLCSVNNINVKTFN